MKTSKILVIIGLLTIVVGCGGQSPRQPLDDPQPRHSPTPIPTPTPIVNPITLTMDQVFNPSVGDVWTFKANCGGAEQTTTVNIESAPVDAAGTTGQHIILHFTKTAPCMYWGLDVPEAEDHFLMLKTSEGWTGRADIPTFPQSCPWCNGGTLFTLNWHPVDGFPTPYVIVPATITQGQTLGGLTKYHWWLLTGLNTTNDIVNPINPIEQGTDMGTAPWKSIFTIEWVVTPVYTGWAIISDQYEGSADPIPTDNPVKWGHEEKWAFAPPDPSQSFNGGLIQIITIKDNVVLLTIKRTN